MKRWLAATALVFLGTLMIINWGTQPLSDEERLTAINKQIAEQSGVVWSYLDFIENNGVEGADKKFRQDAYEATRTVDSLQQEATRLKERMARGQSAPYQSKRVIHSGRLKPLRKIIEDVEQRLSSTNKNCRAQLFLII